MTDLTRSEVTRILRDFEQDRDSAGDLLPLVYDQLRMIAHQRMSDERSGHTLDANGVVRNALLAALLLVGLKVDPRFRSAEPDDGGCNALA